MARNFLPHESSRPISISIPGYNPQLELKKVDLQMERRHKKTRSKQKAAAEKRRQADLQKRKEEERQLEELNMELSTRCSLPVVEDIGDPPCNLFQ